MKIKKITSLCKRNQMAFLWDVTDAEGVVHQWICTGNSAYPVDGLPYLSTENMVTIMDISDKQIEKMQIEHTPAPTNFDFSDTADIEYPAGAAQFSIIYGGETYLIFNAEGNTRFVKYECMAPIYKEHEGVEIWLRKSEAGSPYFAVKAGLLLVGIVMPSNNLDELAGAMEFAASIYRE